MIAPNLPLLPAALRRIGVATAFVGLALAVLFAAVQGVNAGGSVLVGVGVAGLNVLGFAWTTRGMLQGRSAGWGLLSAVKMLLLFGGVAWLVGHEFVRVIPFVMGYASLAVGAVVAQLGASATHEEP